jgi:hypothetical protein
MKKIATTPLEEVKKNSIPIARFLLTEILRTFSKKRLDEVQNFNPGALDDVEHSVQGLPEDDFWGEINEVEVRVGETGSRREERN